MILLYYKYSEKIPLLWNEVYLFVLKGYERGYFKTIHNREKEILKASYNDKIYKLKENEKSLFS